MAQPRPDQPEARTLTESRAGVERTPEQAAHEGALREVAETLRNIEQAIGRAQRAHRAVDSADEGNLGAAFATAAQRLEAARRELVQSAYFGGDQQRMF